ncbi:MAG: hypothetical protein WBO54_19155 [Thermoanaerobaculia bacterium]
MRLINDLKMYARFAAGLPFHLRRTLSLDEAEAIVRQRMSERDRNFLRTVERGIFGQGENPYQWLFKLAGCEFEDLEASVHSNGLEETLRSLRREGVYATFEEQKGRRPIVRQGRELAVEPRDFDNPFTARHYETQTGGSTGAGTRVGVDLDYLASRAPQNYLLEQTFGYYDAPQAYYFTGLPGHGINSVLTRMVYGSYAKRWFNPIPASANRAGLPYRVANFVIPRLLRLGGVPVPLPETVPLTEAHKVARWMVDTLRTEGRCVLCTHVSLGVRVCLAAKERGWSLEGALMTIGAEAPTSAKVRTIEEAGVKPIPVYHMAEIGPLGFGCVNPVDENDIHLLLDHLAVIQAPRQVPGFELEVPAFLFTTLLPTAPKLFINFEGDDYGLLEERSCGCPWEGYGFTLHARNIRSYRKLTTEGMTMVGSDMEKILEDELPERFGGSALDYQMIEEEDVDGLTRLTVIIDPAVPISDDQEVLSYLHDRLGQLKGGWQLVETIWRQAGTLRIRREKPGWTDAAKLMPLRTLKPSATESEPGERVEN